MVWEEIDAEEAKKLEISERIAWARYWKAKEEELYKKYSVLTKDSVLKLLIKYIISDEKRWTR